MTDDAQIRIQRAVAMSCPNCGLSNRRFYHMGEYIRAGGTDPINPGMMWDADGPADRDLILCLECGHVEKWEGENEHHHNDSIDDYRDVYSDWADGIYG